MYEKRENERGGESMTIKELRAQTGLTQAAFAALIGCPKKTVEKWEYRGDPPEYVVKLIEFYINNQK